jgi:hypothetical protein
MAGASRVIGQLDVTPARLIQPATTPTLDDSGSMWRLLRVTPARASIAALLLVALGITLTRTKAAKDSDVAPTIASAPAASDMTAMAEPKETPAPVKDHLLDSAISRKLADEQPARTVKPAPGGAIPSEDMRVAAAAVPDTTAGMRVAAARSAMRARSDSASPPADKARVGFETRGVATLDRMANAGQAAEAAGTRNELSAKVAGVLVGPTTASQCFLVESSAPGAKWGSATLPIVLAFDSAGTTARVLTPGGADTEMRAVRTAGSDSLVLRLRRIGYNGTLALSGSGDARAGVMRSSQLTAQLSEVVTSSTGESRLSAQRSAAAPPAANKPSALEKDASAGASVAISAHVIACGKR